MSGAVWTEDVSLALDFAVHVLQRDGLGVSPFDVHPDGDGRLRALGFTVTSWVQWLTILVDVERSIAATAAEIGKPTRLGAVDRLALLFTNRERPWEHAPGDSLLRRGLREIWDDYLEAAVAWRHAYAMTSRHELMAPRHQRALSRTLHQLGRPGRFLVFVVRYVSPVVMALPPDVCIVARAADDPDGRMYARQVADGARALVERRRRGLGCV